MFAYVEGFKGGPDMEKSIRNCIGPTERLAPMTEVEQYTVFRKFHKNAPVILFINLDYFNIHFLRFFCPILFKLFYNC